MLNKLLWRADKGWPSSLGFWRSATISSPLKLTIERNISYCLGLGLLLWYNASSEVRWGSMDLIDLAEDRNRCCGRSWLWWRTFGFHEIRRISWLTEDFSPSEEGLFSVELFGWLVSVTSTSRNRLSWRRFSWFASDPERKCCISGKVPLHAMKAYGGAEVYSTHSSALEWGE